MLGQLRIFERSHLNKVSFELHLPWRVGVTPFFTIKLDAQARVVRKHL